ncbi:hypothetical protein Q8A73_004332 [Channa argus]|nr:hypothetical protein Q8A73_004332 [Channa argus]
MSSSTNLSDDTLRVRKSSLSYIALISKVILSSPSQKLNLASIYKAMEGQFPYLGSRGPGWNNSVRHNLSVNDCFVKVGHCEEGRGHYCCVQQDHLRDFQQVNFRLYRKVRERFVRPRYDKVGEGHVCRDSSCFLRRLSESRSLGWMQPQYILLELQRYQMNRFDWAKDHYQPWSVNVGCPSWITHCYFPDSQPCGSYGLATAGRQHNIQPLASRLHSWGKKGPVVKGRVK